MPPNCVSVGGSAPAQVSGHGLRSRNTSSRTFQRPGHVLAAATQCTRPPRVAQRKFGVRHEGAHGGGSTTPPPRCARAAPRHALGARPPRRRPHRPLCRRPRQGADARRSWAASTASTCVLERFAPDVKLARPAAILVEPQADRRDARRRRCSTAGVAPQCARRDAGGAAVVVKAGATVCGTFASRSSSTTWCAAAYGAAVVDGGVPPALPPSARPRRRPPRRRRPSASHLQSPLGGVGLLGAAAPERRRPERGEAARVVRR